MIAVIFIALAVIAYRIRKRLFSKAEAAVVAVFATCLVVIWLQILICDHVAFPEKRYWIQSAIMLSAWAVWGIRELSKQRNKVVAFCGRYLLPIVITCLALTDIVMLVKPYIPGSRRNAYVSATKWAAEKIRADWKGPSRDESVDFFAGEYRHPARPIVRCHTARLSYVVGGRKDPTLHQPDDPMADYICHEEAKIDFDSEPLSGAKYELMDRLRIGKRRFALYKRIEEPMQ